MKDKWLGVLQEAQENYEKPDDNTRIILMLANGETIYNQKIWDAFLESLPPPPYPAHKMIIYGPHEHDKEKIQKATYLKNETWVWEYAFRSWCDIRQVNMILEAVSAAVESHGSVPERIYLVSETCLPIGSYDMFEQQQSPFIMHGVLWSCFDKSWICLLLAYRNAPELLNTIIERSLTEGIYRDVLYKSCPDETAFLKIIAKHAIQYQSSEFTVLNSIKNTWEKEPSVTDILSLDKYRTPGIMVGPTTWTTYDKDHVWSSFNDRQLGTITKTTSTLKFLLNDLYLSRIDDVFFGDILLFNVKNNIITFINLRTWTEYDYISINYNKKFYKMIMSGSGHNCLRYVSVKHDGIELKVRFEHVFSDGDPIPLLPPWEPKYPIIAKALWLRKVALTPEDCEKALPQIECMWNNNMWEKGITFRNEIPRYDISIERIKLNINSSDPWWKEKSMVQNRVGLSSSIVRKLDTKLSLHVLGLMQLWRENIDPHRPASFCDALNAGNWGLWLNRVELHFGENKVNANELFEVNDETKICTLISEEELKKYIQLSEYKGITLHIIPPVLESNKHKRDS
jgi:hypothetical protein